MARSSHRDGQALRIIQYLGLVFLPLSLCTSVFGMGFFSTNFDPRDPSKPLFSVADCWWWFLAFAVPFTIVVLVIAWCSTGWTTAKEEERRRSDMTDLEKMLSYEMTVTDKLDSDTAPQEP
ncbi:hypothetical protein LTR37_002449 [Vermiconidia calcicola]|uniref:Uncharacterized protein n=1 Tax=Vermiconidia calcicola TaxID=1690605 RepID=A0ACC3NT24_9PEZI|nr:hypothetical protein LTR37_002449 [Vermiconidia calcicola]